MARKRATERAAFALLSLSSLLVIAPVTLIVYYILVRGAAAITPEFLLEPPRSSMKAGGIFPAIVGTLYLVAGTAAVALPLGTGAAIYLSEYARQDRLTRTIRLAILNLAGVPSIVFGLFGLGLFVLFLGFGASLLAGSLTLGLLVLPLVITTAEEAIRAVPASYRQASLALGATRWQTVRHAVLPSALPGILTGMILSIGRAAGETAPILLTAAAFYLPHLPRSPFDQVMALPYHLYVISTQVPNMPLKTQYGTALVLLGTIMLANVAAIIVRSRARRLRPR